MKTLVNFARAAAMTMLLVLMLMAANTAWAQDPTPTLSKAEGKDYYTIGNADDWSNFVLDVNGGYSYVGETVKLTGQLTNISAPVGTSNHPFCGTFDGGGQSIEINVSDDQNEGAALFRYISGATIENLTVSGEVSSTKEYAAGLVGFVVGENTNSLIKNCAVYTRIEGDENIGGILGNVAAGDVTIEGCVFNGSIPAGTCCTFLYSAESNGTKEIINCVYIPETSNVLPLVPSESGVLLTNCFICNDLHTITKNNNDVAIHFSSEDNNYDVSYIIAPNDGGLIYDMMYFSEGMKIKFISIASANTYTVQCTDDDGNEIALDNSNGELTLTMPAKNVTATSIPVYELIIPDEYVTTSTAPTVIYGEKHYYKDGVTISLSHIDRDGYRFEGYSVNESEDLVTGSEVITMPDADATIKGVYIANQYPITYNLNNGAFPEGTLAPSYHTVEDDVITLPVPERASCTFGGWYNNEKLTGTPKTTIPAFSTGEVALYAKWEMTISDTKELTDFANAVNADENNNTFQGVTVKLDKDIDFNPSDDVENNFTPIGTSEEKPFLGTFDGGSHTISGIRIKNEDGYRQGLFGYIGENAVVKDVVLSNAKIIGYGYVGGIVGYNDGGTVSGCTVTSDVFVEGNHNVGGIAGYGWCFWSGNVQGCISSAQLQGTGYCPYKFGGIAGSIDGILSDNIVINATINCLKETGAIAGEYSGSLSNNFYYNCTVCGTQNATNIGCDGKDVSNDENPNGAVSGCVMPECMDVVSATLNDGGKVFYVLAIKFGYKATSVTMDGKGIDADDNGKYTVTVSPGSEIQAVYEETLEIATPDDLIAFSKAVNQGNDFSGKTITVVQDIDFKPSDGVDNNFTPIGESEKPFLGTFDGGNHTISGIRIKKEDEDNQGLFGIIGAYNKTAEVKDVVLSNAKISGNCHVGGIVGLIDYGTVSGCAVTSDVVVKGFYYVGGIAGLNNGRNKLSDNIVINATIVFPDDSEYKTFGAITGENYGTLTNNYYYNCTLNDTPTVTGIGCNGSDVNDDQNNDGAVPADLLIDGDSEEPVVVRETTGNQSVIFRRSFKTGITATVILPFGFNAIEYFDGKGTFHTLDKVAYNTETSQWEAKPSAPIDKIEANHPYIFKPTANFGFVVFNGVDVENNTGTSKASSEIEISVETTAKNWYLVGVYTNKTWYARTPNEYGFAAKQISYTDNETKEEVNITAGEFVRAGANAKMKPTRAYLRYTGNDNPFAKSKSASELPDRIVLIFPDETASVIDNPSPDPSDPDDDIPTPTSELAPTANVKVWSFDKTVYIAAAPNTAYRIIDANGRVLKDGITQSDRDEVRLGRSSGIVVVIINGKTYKVAY